MLRGLYTATAGMLTQQRRTEMLSNNMANANTAGYKADQSTIRAFPEMLLQRMENKTLPTGNGINVPGMQTIGSLNTGSYVQEIKSPFLQGGLKETGLVTDVALVEENVPLNPETNVKGSLFFVVQNQAGEERYTRNGHFTLDNNGLLFSDGNPVLSTTGQPISIQSGEFNVTENGDVYVSGDPEPVAQIDVRFAADVRNLVKDGNGIYRTSDGQALPTAINNGDIQYNLKQKSLENSTVDIGRTYTDMMTAYRSFEANQKVLQAYDKSMEKAANEIGRLS
ncbi:flagellar hook-basal body protein [Metabacillus halosaccharovorans]|uniref:Flagellar hook-basal body protein n=1 Tax=Metabacillus halosaccharovorans TaxID=930124 RepID=A0ABT3DHX3_9BACI|nr:flagellar hook-basal body protein [Metabacillus halosaccharovorans]MCV9886665.1 flagellar hook-basal body protein [Metabacillus halosaccharovorans]